MAWWVAEAFSLAAVYCNLWRNVKVYHLLCQIKPDIVSAWSMSMSGKGLNLFTLWVGGLGLGFVFIDILILLMMCFGNEPCDEILCRPKFMVFGFPIVWWMIGLGNKQGNLTKQVRNSTSEWIKRSTKQASKNKTKNCPHYSARCKHKFKKTI